MIADGGYVDLQITFRSTAPATRVTLHKLVLTFVDQGMLGRRVAGWITDGVGQLVPSEVAIAPEDLLALVALVRLVIRVSKQVGFQV